jgi:hypothetical protein
LSVRLDRKDPKKEDMSVLGLKLEGKPVEAGRFVDLEEGDELEIGDGKKYTISYGGEAFTNSHVTTSGI